MGELFVRVTALVASLNQVRRVAAGGGLRLVVEAPGHEPETVVLPFLKCGRALVEVGPMC